MPFLYSDAQDMWDVLNGDEGLQFITAIDESNLGIKTLSWYDAGARSFYSVKPVMNIQDLSGLNIRVQESELMSEIIEMLEIHPFFILAGNIMNKGGIAIKLINFAKIFTGRIPGSLAHTNVVANMLFGAISGSGTAAASAMGAIIGPVEEEEGYDKNFSDNVMGNGIYRNTSSYIRRNA